MKTLLLAVVVLFAQPIAGSAGLYAQTEPDYTSVDSILENLYASITFDRETSPDWELFRALFIEDAKLIPTNSPSQNLPVLSPEEFVKSFQGQIDSGGLHSFLEREISRETDRFGNVLQVFSTYETEFSNQNTSEGYSRGINSIQLVWHNGRWWIASIVWDDEREGQTIPGRYLD